MQNNVASFTKTRSDGTCVKYYVHSIIGRGGFGTVYLVFESESQTYYALKVVSKSKIPSRIYKNEYKIQKDLENKNVIRCFDFFEDSENSYILFEYCPDGCIGDELIKKGKYNEKETAEIIAQVLNGLSYLRKCKIVHKDIKIDNLLFGRDGQVKISDFGMSEKDPESHNYFPSLDGTIVYLPPEIINGSTPANIYERDIWALGVCAFVMLTGRYPFDWKSNEKVHDKIVTAQHKWPLSSKISFIARDFIDRIFKSDPGKRPTLEQLRKHPFISSYFNEEIEQIDTQFPSCSVFKYCISNKFASLYMLANGCVGALFENNTNLTVDSKRKIVQEYNPITKAIVVYQLTEEIKARTRVNILLNAQKSFNKITRAPISEEFDGSKVIPFITKITKNESYVCFVFNDERMQVNFTNKTKASIDLENRYILCGTSVIQNGTVIPFHDLFTKTTELNKSLLSLIPSNYLEC